MSWKELAYTSHYQTAVAIREVLQQGQIEESEIGLEELIEALSRSEKRALRSQLTRLMMHIIKWQIEPQCRSRSWVATISNARVEIAALLKEEPSLKPRVPELWEDCFKDACKMAKDETGIKPFLKELSWYEVFEQEYSLQTQ